MRWLLASRRRVVLVALAALLLSIWAYAFVAARSTPIAEHPFVAARGPLVIAHRGGRGHWPENTLYAFRRAAARGVDVLEMDVRTAADGALVVFHDGDVSRTTHGRGRVEELSSAVLGELDAGYSWSSDGGETHPYRGRGIGIPTLRDVFGALPDMRMNLEIKDASQPRSLCALIRVTGRQEQVLVASFEHAAMEEFRSLCPEVATSTTASEAQSFYLLHLVALPGLFQPRAEALQVPARLGRLEIVTPAFLRAARRLNVRVHVWTANRLDELERLLELGVDGIMTDYPERLMTLLGR
ncbi:MAG: glycerophosphodiester phosphodiesterase [Myxococcota bacterium]